MNIEMINASEKSNVMNRIKYSNQTSENARIADQMAGYSLDITGKVMENAAYGKGDLLSMEDVSMKAGLVDVSAQRNYMAVMSNSMSDEDFSELLKEGYNPTHTEISEAVTNLDKIKAKMAESGNVIEGFNDDLSREDMEKVLGMAAAGIEAALKENNLPTTNENIDNMKEAINIANKINPLTEEAMAFMLKNGMEPTISNIYTAEHSSMADNYSAAGSVVLSGGRAYATAQQTDKVWDSIKSQAEKIIEEAGLVADNENLDNAKWLVENQIPLCEENLKSYAEIKNLELPADKKTLFDAMTTAIKEGKNPTDANLAKTESIYEKAVKIINEFDNADDYGDLTRKRQLEEIRLAMTVEANMTLLRKGITLDTKNLENIVDQLKTAEAEFYKPILGEASEESTDLFEKIDLYKETSEAIELLRFAPVQSVGDLIETKAEFNLNNLQIAAKSLLEEKAGSTYESLMTAPRADMGDSITKAFRNVDDILKDLDMALSEDNRRAVRIMGYSQMQITREAVEEVRIAANTVSSVIEMMTPAKTLQMIREGHNPLNENLYELVKELKKESVEESTEKYSEFLVKLERRGEISEDEKSAYIGMYRLFNKIEKRDYKTIGKVLSQGEDLTFKNLLTAYRSGKFKGIDINIDDEFGALSDVITKGESITDQIEKGFLEVRQQETPEEYISDKLSMINEAAGMEEAEELLEQLEIPVNVENILAAADFSVRGRKPFEKITSGKEENDEADKAKGKIRESARNVADALDDKEKVLEAYSEFGKTASEAIKDMMYRAESYSDVKEWSKLHKQIAIAGELAKNDEYVVPIETDEGLMSIRLSIRQSDENAGRVEASFETERFGLIKAMFTVNDNTVNGIVSARYNGGFDIIKDKETDIKAALEKSNFNVGNISYVKVNDNSDTKMAAGGKATNNRLFAAAKAFIKAMEKGVTEYEG